MGVWGNHTFDREKIQQKSNKDAVQDHVLRKTLRVATFKKGIQGGKGAKNNETLDHKRRKISMTRMEDIPEKFEMPTFPDDDDALEKGFRYARAILGKKHLSMRVKCHAHKKYNARKKGRQPQ